ncbi:3-oxoacyl-[acyl-carrier-protein] synthase II, chloroplastic isoform X1, partial [Tanacetum coccineum]
LFDEYGVMNPCVVKNKTDEGYVMVYEGFGYIELAEKVFDEMTLRDLVSWNSMINGYTLDWEGFVSCHSLSERNNDLTKESRPWDVQSSDGFVMEEGVGVLLLEELEHVKSSTRGVDC